MQLEIWNRHLYDTTVGHNVVYYYFISTPRYDTTRFCHMGAILFSHPKRSIIRSCWAEWCGVTLSNTHIGMYIH